MDVVWFGDCANHCADMVAEFLLQFRRRFVPLLEGNENGNSLPFKFMRSADCSGFGDGRVGDEGGLDLRCTEAVAGYVKNVVKATDDPEVTLLVALGAITCRVEAGIVREIGFLETGFVSVNRAGH